MPGRNAAGPIVLCIAIATLLLSACSASPQTSGTREQDQAPPNWPERMADFRFRWTSEPGIDLTTGQSVPLRAYLESWLAISYTNDVQAGYPGYDRATPPYVAPWTPEWLSLPQAKRLTHAFLGGSEQDQQRIVGNEDLHILQVDQTHDGFRAFVCDATYGVYRQMPNTTSFTPLKLELTGAGSKSDVANMEVWRVEFTEAGNTPSPTLPQKGPLPAPIDDVFGPWFVTGFHSVRFWADSDHPGLAPGSPEAERRDAEAANAEDLMRQRCLDRYPADTKQRQKSATAVLDTQPPTSPAVPGWPEKE